MNIEKLRKGQKLKNRYSQAVVEILEVQDEGAKVRIILQGGFGRHFFLHKDTMRNSYRVATKGDKTKSASWVDTDMVYRG